MIMYKGFMPAINKVKIATTITPKLKAALAKETKHSGISINFILEKGAWMYLQSLPPLPEKSK